MLRLVQTCISKWTPEMSVVENKLVLLGTQSGQAWLPLVSFLLITDVVERASTRAKKKALRGLKGKEEADLIGRWRAGLR